MKILICGSRSINDPALVAQAIEKSGMKLTHVVSGGARGVDTLLVSTPGPEVSSSPQYVADWNKYGKRAGHIHNRLMVGQSMRSSRHVTE